MKEFIMMYMICGACSCEFVYQYEKFRKEQWFTFSKYMTLFLLFWIIYPLAVLFAIREIVLRNKK